MGEEPVSEGNDATDPTAKPQAVPSDPDELVRFLEGRRARLASTVDELVIRATPGEMARRTRARLLDRLRAATHASDGDLRWERVAAVSAAAVVSLLTLGILLRRRLR
jgi:hypothetical protein